MEVEAELKAFADELAADVEDGVASGEGEPWKEHEFTRQVLERLGEAGVLENPQALPRGGSGKFGRGGGEYEIFGFCIPDDDPERIVIVTTVYKGKGAGGLLDPGDVKKAAERAARFVTASFDGLHERLEPSNTDASDLSRRLLELKDDIHSVRIAVLSDCPTKGKPATETEKGQIRFDIDVFDLERLFRVLGKGQTREDIELDFRASPGGPLPCLRVPGSEEGFDAYLAAVPGETLANVYDKYGTRLLELNVRAFLGIRGRKSVNAGLRETITKEPDRFLAFNNGIVATVDEVETEIQEDGTVALVRVAGLQIVNGGQTTASLHRARRVDRADLSSVRVPAKLIHVRGGDLQAMVASISRSANSQNTVQPADFSANDPFHVKVEALANNTWCADGRTRWFYDRARGSYEAAEYRASASAAARRQFKSQSPKDKRFTKTDLAKYLNAWDGYPHLVCFGGQKNFQAFMQRLKDEKLGPDRIDEAWYRRFIAITMIFRAMHKVVRQLKFPAYQANIVAYVVSGLAYAARGRVDFERIWSKGPSAELLALLGEWARLVDGLLRETAGQRMPTEWSKKAQCWEELRARLPALPDRLPPEILPAEVVADDEDPEDGLGATVTPEDLEVVRRAQTVPAGDWQAVAQWGEGTRGAQWRLGGVVRTMAECASEGWRRAPTPRLAKRALRALELFRDEGAERKAG